MHIQCKARRILFHIHCGIAQRMSYPLKPYDRPCTIRSGEAIPPFDGWCAYALVKSDQIISLITYAMPLFHLLHPLMREKSNWTLVIINTSNSPNNDHVVNTTQNKWHSSLDIPLYYL